MGGFVAPIISAVGGTEVFGGIVSTILGSALAPSVPSPAAPPAPPTPEPAPAPPAPAPTESAAPDVKGEAPVIDTEAARVRAVKRRKAAEDRRLFSLSEEDSDAVILTKSLLGD